MSRLLGPDASRRTWLRHLLLVSAQLGASRAHAAARQAAPATAAPPRWSRDPFQLGVASGQPRAGSIVLWTRLAPQPLLPDAGMPALPVSLRWEVAEDEHFARIIRSGMATAHPALGHSVHVQVDALAADRRYFYRFICGDAVSRTGRTRTAPARHSTVDRLRWALASCQHYEQGHFTAHREMAARELDFVLFVGDYIYDNTARGARMRLHEAERPATLADYRARHATYKLDADLQACHAAHPWIMCWDDHEVRNDYAAGLATGELSAAAFVELRAAAWQAYFEHLPLALDQAPGTVGVRMHDRFQWGTLAELWTLDGRQHRSAQACNAPGTAGGQLLWRCAELAEPRRSMLGAAQEAWLHRGLSSSQCRWQLLAQATQMSPSSIETPAGRLVYSDGWDGYAPARQRLLEQVHRLGLRSTVVLGGDVHRHVAAALRTTPNRPDAPVVASELVSTSITSRGVSVPITEQMRRSNPDILHARSDERGYMFCELSDRWLHCEARATVFPVTAQATFRTQARFAIEAGHPGPQRA